MTYNNETGLYEFDEWTREAQWFVDHRDHLFAHVYIIPLPGMVTEIDEAPDNDITAALEAVWRNGPISEELASSLGLTPVPPGWRGFSEEDGYYIEQGFFSTQEYLGEEEDPE